MLYNTIHQQKKDSDDKSNSIANPLTLGTLCEKLKRVHGNKDSKKVLIVSCFYSKDAIETLFNALWGRDVSIIVSALGHSVEKLNEMVVDLKQIKRKGNKKIYICNKYPLLHSKMYYAECDRVDGAHCLVGSSNLSNNGFEINEEILVNVEDTETKKQIRAYIESLKEISIDIDKKKLCSTINRTNFMSFISSGYIVFRPNDQIQLNYSGEPLRKVAELLNEKVVNGNRNSELSISIEEYLVKKLNITIDTQIKTGVRIKDHCIETCFGFWLPPGNHHSKVVEGKTDEIKEKNEEKIEEIINGLSCIDILDGKFHDFLEEFYNSLSYDGKSISIGDSLKDEIRADIEVFIKRKINYLKNRKESLAQGFFVTPMPYFWDDAVAAKEFYESFWENVLSRKNGGLAKKIIIFFEDSDKYENYDWNTLKTNQNIEWE